MTNEQRRENWEQFAMATDHLLAHPDISEKLLGALHGFIQSPITRVFSTQCVQQCVQTAEKGIVAMPLNC